MISDEIRTSNVLLDDGQVEHLMGENDWLIEPLSVPVAECFNDMLNAREIEAESVEPEYWGERTKTFLKSLYSYGFVIGRNPDFKDEPTNLSERIGQRGEPVESHADRDV